MESCAHCAAGMMDLSNSAGVAAPLLPSMEWNPSNVQSLAPLCSEKARILTSALVRLDAAAGKITALENVPSPTFSMDGSRTHFEPFPEELHHNAIVLGKMATTMDCSLPPTDHWSARVYISVTAFASSSPFNE